MNERKNNLPSGDPLYGEALDFLYDEAELLDAGRFTEWLDLMAEDLTYRMPARQNRSHKAKTDTTETEIFSDNIASLRLRVQRLGTDMAWAESTPSRTRHLVTNVRVRATAMPDELEVSSYILVYRDRPVPAAPSSYSGERQDLLRKVDGRWRLARRTILLDQAVLTTRNLSIFF
jgi:3-phenylpropionate/cinnamic acid dioxygenase small subunit